MDKGKFFQTRRSFPWYSFSTSFTVASAWEQKGHWKSPKNTRVTGAAAGPLLGLPPTGTFHTVVVSSGGSLGSSPALALLGGVKLILLTVRYRSSRGVPLSSVARACFIVSSMASWKTSMGSAPETKAPLMKKAGVPSTPSFSPSAMSCATFSEGKPLASLAWSVAGSTPAACASASKVSPIFVSGSSASWNFQKASAPPMEKIALAASDAGRACGWKLSGKCFHTMRSLSGP